MLGKIKIHKDIIEDESFFDFFTCYFDIIYSVIVEYGLVEVLCDSELFRELTIEEDIPQYIVLVMVQEDEDSKHLIITDVIENKE